MAPTRTVKNKHAANRSGIKGSKASKMTHSDGVVKSKKPQGKSSTGVQLGAGRSKMMELLKKKRKGRVFSEKELDIPKLNTITPVGVQKPKGKKIGKVFVDDRESMTTILAMVQAEKDGQIESKIMKARQMEEIRQARLVEAEKKESERKSKLEDTKASLRKKRKRNVKGADGDDTSVNTMASEGTKATKAKKKRVSFAKEPETDG
ncbi:60S ribosomal subunit assembly export protein loc-1 [Grosmannia clavigera kw1407]|uniref:60S ribosomal subunit assembly export protein loc-1 n=1 Tax=Grosmannia clavigera (strain kw1407 / UAMH 11150) TaxID=655863 RepID=F0X8U3_GROCL|nr:60S ribosomal subunit assembly export protein loc-1 [Grosmannia clavigera kw1407]EFX05703.1 60S ribosomal subunit assembly export protein loc-1 [Grosmannia clavigera kw1407]